MNGGCFRGAFLLGATLILALLPISLSAQGQRPVVHHKEIRFDLISSPGVVIFDVIPVPLDQVEPFLAIGAAWEISSEVRLSLRASTNGVDWGKWMLLEAHNDFANELGEQVSGLLLLDQRTRFVQYRVEVGEPDKKGSLRIFFISPGATSREMQENIQRKSKEAMSTENLLQQQLQQQPKYPKPPVVTRTEWGCPDGQITTHGSLSYTTVTHLIVHHTFSPSSATDGDWAALVRAVWNFQCFLEWMGRHRLQLCD